jgi:ribonuclease HII
MICGTDEAGRGPVLGPLVVAGVMFDEEKKLNDLSVKDSKKLSPKKRESLSRTIRKNSTAYEILVIPAQDIDDMRKVMTLNEMEVIAFVKVIKKLKPQICYVDSADVNEERFGENISSGLNFKARIISRHKADDIYPVVSAASILAKTRRDYEIRIIANELEKKVNLPLGSGYPADPITRNFLKSWLKKYGKLPPHTRHSWKTAQNLLKDKSIKKLDDY